MCEASISCSFWGSRSKLQSEFTLLDRTSENQAHSMCAFTTACFKASTRQLFCRMLYPAGSLLDHSRRSDCQHHACDGGKLSGVLRTRRRRGTVNTTARLTFMVSVLLSYVTVMEGAPK